MKADGGLRLCSSCRVKPKELWSVNIPHQETNPEKERKTHELLGMAGPEESVDSGTSSFSGGLCGFLL